MLLLTPAWGRSGRAAVLSAEAYAGLPAVESGRVFVIPFEATVIRHPGSALIELAMLLALPGR